MTVKSITPTEVYRLHQESGSLTLIDVREISEFSEIRSPLAQNHPLTKFNPTELATKKDLDTPLFLLCRSGRRSLRAAELLIQIGFRTVYNVEGGMIEWEASGLPVVKK
jgi:rhodanese-related sulfurtransferase